ncbi:NUDIX domain-containing protein [Sphaerisporangium dianthi]|uniref:NUDIX domain-containing protein n=1 Tax=Sphaerisporangium dianthi TaxID=1436120 RepID=A0ABV9CQD3_9ACTN
MSRPGFDHIGVGVGIVIFGEGNRMFLARRGPKARNEPGTWEFPGGGVELGEALESAIKREIREEYGMEVELTGTLGAFDHFLPGAEHWVSITYCGKHVRGEPVIREPGKCTDIGWFDLWNLPKRLSEITQKNVKELLRRKSRKDGDSGHR